MSTKSYILDIFNMSIEEKVTALSFQGIVNRDAPHIFCRAHFWNWPESDDKWIEYFQDKKDVEFTTLETLPELFDLFRDRVKGCIVWDPKLSQSMWVAATIAGLDDLLPIAPECIGRYGDLPIVEDLRGKWKEEMEVARWSMDNLIPRCNKTMVYSIEHTWSGCTLDSIDYATNNKMFIYALRHGKERENVGDWQKEAALAHEVHTYIGPNAAVFGWGEPEDCYCQLISHHDNFVYCAEAPNLSFFARFPATRTDYKQPARKDPSEFKLEDKHYIEFNTSEGDTPKMVVALMGGAWFDKNRGKVYVNWGINPLHLKFFPILFEYFYDTATDKDYFMGGASGAGYTYPNQMADPTAYHAQTKEYFELGDMHESDCWMHFCGAAYDRYAKDTGMDAISMPCGPYGVTLVNGGTCAVFLRGNSGLNYFNSDGTPEDLANAIKAHCEKRPKPSFTSIHVVPDADNPAAQGGYSPSDFLKTESLLSDEYEVTTIQKMGVLAKQAIKEGKILDARDPNYSEWEDVRKKK